MGFDLQVFDTPQQAAEACGAAIFEHASKARAERGHANIAVSGGSTPRIMFEWMAKQSFDWSNVHLFWVDERCVPPTDEQSNYRMTKLSLLDAIALPAAQIHRIEGELDPSIAASNYAAGIYAHFELSDAKLPIFDVIQRGMGPDSHTASLFPGEPMISDDTNIAAALWVEKMHQHRVTLLRGVLEHARVTLNLVTGKDKTEALEQVLHGERDLLAHPAQISSADLIWFLDKAASPPA